MATQQEKVVRLMVRDREQEWFYPVDFQRPGLGDLFVGYEASARFSELMSDFPAMLEERRRGKYKERRIRYETINEWWGSLPANLQAIFEDAGIGPVPEMTV